jgi:hypothetical protein
MSHPQYIAKVEPNLLDSHHHQPSKESGAHDGAHYARDVRLVLWGLVIGSPRHSLAYSRCFVICEWLQPSAVRSAIV